MAKRGADNQKTREGGDSDEEQIDDPGNRSTPLAPVEGRVIRGMPKRKGLGGGALAPSPAPAASTPSAAPASTPFSGFSFGGGAPAPSSSSPFVFGGSSTTPAPAAVSTPAAAAPSNPFSGFSFAKPATPAPAPSAAPTMEVAKPTFGFGAKPSTPAAPASTTPATTTAVPPKPFANFSFAKPSTPAPTPAVTTPSSTPAPPASNPFAFGATSKPSSSAPVPTPAAASSTTSSSTFATSSASTAATSTKPDEPMPSQPTPPPEGEVSYYTSLRGLNTSILSFLTSTIEADQFIDLSVVLPSLLKQYDEHLDEAAKKGGWRPEGKKASVAPTVNGESSKAVNGTSAPFKMPAAPASGGFALPKAPTSNTNASTPSFGGFTPTPSAGGSSSGFTFGSAKPATSAPTPAPAKVETPKKPSSEVTKLVQDVISGKSDENKEEPKTDASKPFSFGAPSSTPESSKKGNSLFSFAPSGPLHPPTPESKTFSPSSTLENATPAKLGKFGPGGSQPQLAFGGAKSSPGGQATPGTPAAAANKPFSFGFGSGSGNAAVTSSASTAPSGSATFSFGSSSSSTPASGSTAPTFSFGSTSSSAPKPAATPSFSFGGSSSSNTTTSAPSFSFGAKPSTTPAANAPSSGFSFSGFTPKPAATETGGTEPAEGNSELPPENAEPSKNLAETTGAGEENEDTVVEQRGKLNKLEGGEFKLEGLGQFKLKRSKDVNGDGKMKRRLLMRTDGSGHVILNMSVNSSFKPTVEGAHVKFLGFDNDGKPVPYALRVKNPEVAKKIQEELQKEVDAIKGE